MKCSRIQNQILFSLNWLHEFKISQTKIEAKDTFQFIKQIKRRWYLKLGVFKQINLSIFFVSKKISFDFPCEFFCVHMQNIMKKQSQNDHKNR
jgi:hypothetical protein